MMIYIIIECILFYYSFFAWYFSRTVYSKITSIKETIMQPTTNTGGVKLQKLKSSDDIHANSLFVIKRGMFLSCGNTRL